MALIPKDATGRLAYFNTHAPIWVERAAEIGLDEERAQAVHDAVEAAKAAQLAANMAAEAAKSATILWNAAEERLTRLGSGAIRTIKAFADSRETPQETGDVYSAASIDRPNRPGPKRRDQSERNNAVPRVRNVEATPDAWGNVRLTWTSVRGETMGAGAGMTYRIERWINGHRDAAQLLAVVTGPGAGRTRSTYTDRAVPRGVESVQYAVTPMQGGGVGPTSYPAVVQFGSIGIGGPVRGVGARAA